MDLSIDLSICISIDLDRACYMYPPSCDTPLLRPRAGAVRGTMS